MTLDELKMHLRNSLFIYNDFRGVNTWSLVEDFVKRTGNVHFAIAYGRLLATPERNQKQIERERILLKASIES